MILSVHISGMDSNAASFSGVEDILNDRESSRIYCSGSVFTFLIAVFILGNLFCAKYK